MASYNIVLQPAAAPEKITRREVQILVNGAVQTTVSLGPTDTHAGPVEAKPGDSVSALATSVAADGRLSAPAAYRELLPLPVVLDPVEPPIIAGLEIVPAPQPAQ